MSTRFHPGELRAQMLAGVSASDGAIRDAMPDQHRDFFATLPFILAATLDADGAPRAQVWSGAPGFISSPDAATLRLTMDLAPARDDGAAPALQPGARVGLLGLDFATRRRNRVNGVVRAGGSDALTVQVRESFGNCPQHITRRAVRMVAPHAHPAHPVQVSSSLDAAARSLIARADTLFIATSGGKYGVDMSHRGGPPGFARIDGDQLVIPDFNGNRYFNTFGNLLVDPRAALLFIDFASGDVLELTGTCTIAWQSAPAIPGQEGGRQWRFTLARASFQRAPLALRWDAVETV